MFIFAARRRFADLTRHVFAVSTALSGG